MDCFIKFLSLVTIIWLCACGGDSTTSKTSVPSAAAQNVLQNNAKKPVESENFGNSILDFEEIYTDDDRLTYEGYEVEKRAKMIWLKEAETKAEVTYVVLKRKGKTAAAFEGVQYPLGNDARFGLFPVLGQKTKQLIIEQEAQRTWRHWVVSLSPSFKVIYDSGDYPVGHSLRGVDIDGDGSYELIQSLHSFWFWGRLTNVDSPLPEIIFVYNPARRKYIPANPQFRKFALRDIEDKIRKAQEIKSESGAQGQDGGKLGAVLEVVLSYIYAGRGREAWSFYENEYNLPDKEKIRREIQNELSEDAVYKTLKK